MRNSQELHQSENNPHPSNNVNLEFTPTKQDIFAFLKKQENPTPINSSPSFFSENGLYQDIIKVTGAEPDICLEVFYALYNTLWPQIESQSDVSFKDAWTRFIGGSVYKGSLSPPEKLIIERRVKDIKRIMSEPEGEAQIFHDLDGVISSILNLKQKINDYPEEIISKKEVIDSLTLTQEFYQSYRDQMKALVQAILEKERINASYGSENDALEELLEPKAIMMSDIFAHHWAYRISRSQARKLLSLDPNGRNLKSHTHSHGPSNHRVIAFPEKVSEPLVFFKANGNPPIQPEKEFMLYSLYRHLQILVPETALLILTDVFETNPDYFYAVQASEAVIGEPSSKAMQDPETPFDHEAYVSQTIGAFLTNPSDGSFKNFKYSPKYKTLISIDNDMVFKQELTGKDDNKKMVNIKSILYLLPQIDLPLPESIRTFFTSLDPHLLTLLWLQDLTQKNREYQLLFAKLPFQRTRCAYQNLHPQNGTPSLSACLQQKIQVDRDLHGGSFYPQILIPKDLLTCFVEKLQMIEKTLRNNRSASAQIIFEEISPVIAKYYRKLRFEFSDPEEALEALWGEKKNGVDYSYISSLLDHEEDLSDLSSNKNEINENLTPETFIKEYKDLLTSVLTPLDSYIRRQGERKKKNSLNLQVALHELKFLVQEGLTNSQSPRDIVDFCHTLSKMTDNNSNLIKEITFLLSNLPHPELKWLLTLERYFLRADRSVPTDLTSSSVSILGAFMKKRTFILTESENQYLFDQQGDIKKNTSLTGRSRVTCFPNEQPEFYLKQYPEWPGYEFASTLFMRLLGIQHLPYQDLLVIDSKYPVLLTQRVHGDPVLRIWNNSQAFKNLDPVHTGLLIISAMLINPEDGKEDNFILSEDKKYLIPIDNDHCFLPSFFQKGGFWNAFTVNTALQTKTLLFCLDEMQKPIPLEVQKQILSINFDELFTKWMTELDNLENKLNNVTDPDQRKQFLEQGTVMKIPFYEPFIHNLHWKAHKIQDLLKVASFELTPFDLLKAVEPFAARCYENSFKQGNSLQSRFKAATENLYKKASIDGSRVSILNTRTMMEIINVSEKDLQKEDQRMGPIDSLTLLDQLSQEYSEKVRKEQEMLCELDDQSQEKKWVNLFGGPLGEAALKAFLANPKEGLILKGSRLIFSSKLTELFAQNPDKGMKIRFLSLPESPFLNEKDIRILAESCPNIEYLNVNSCGKLTKIITAEGEWPLLSRLEAKDCLNLEKFVHYSPIQILRIETDQDIEVFVEKPTLNIFTISKKEIEFEFSFKEGESLEIKSQGHILSNDNFLLRVIRGKEEVEKYLSNFQVNLQIPSILSGKVLQGFITSINLKYSNINVEDIRKISLLNLKNLQSLNLSQNKIRSESVKYLIQGNWPKLNHLDLSENQQIFFDEAMKTFIQGNWPLLETLNLSKTNLTIEILVNQAKWPQLKHLNLSDNEEIGDEGLTTLSQGDWPLLETLNISKTNLTQMNIEIFVNRSNWPQLKHLDLSENNIYDEGLEILSEAANWPLLEVLVLNKSQITKGQFLRFILTTKWPNLKEVHFDSVGNNAAQNLLQKNWVLLEHLDLSRGEVTQNEIQGIIKRSCWPQLKSLNLSSNPISDVGLEILTQENWPLLEILNVEDTKITALGVETIVNRSNWPKLKSLNLSSNSISHEGLQILAQGNWPLIDSLGLNNSHIPKKSFLNFILNTKWSNLQEVHFDSVGNNAAKNLLPKNWHLLEHLDLSHGEIAQNEIEVIVSRCKWPQLKYLDLSGNGIDDKGLQILAQGNWPLLETLNLNDSRFSKRSFLNFIMSKKWSNLKEVYFDPVGNNAGKNLGPKQWHLLEQLDLSSGKITQNEIVAIINRCSWPRLKSLDLSGNEIHYGGVEALSQGNWPLLEVLNLSKINMTAVGVETFANRAKWPQLKQLNLSDNQIQNAGLGRLTSVDWKLLEDLNIQNAGVTNKGIEMFISNRSNLPHLKRVNISHNPIQNRGLEIIASSKWTELELLNLEKTEITNEGIEILIKKSHWPNLKALDISDNRIWDEGLQTLSHGEWPLLENLSLRKLEITGEGIKSMTRISQWPSLKTLDLSESERIFTRVLFVLTAGKWPLLEYLNLKNTNITAVDIQDLFSTCSWHCLKKIHFQGLTDHEIAVINLRQSVILEKCPDVKVIIS